MKALIRRIFPEPCMAVREGRHEASAGVHMARDIEQRKVCGPGRRAFQDGRRQHVRYRYDERANRPAVSETPWTCVRISSGPGRSLCCPSPRAGPPTRRHSRSTDARQREVRCAHSSDEACEQSMGGPMWRSGWSKAAHPRGNRKPWRAPDTGPGSCAIGGPDTAQSWSIRVKVDLLRPRVADYSPTLCVGARPEGGAGCVSAHVQICAPVSFKKVLNGVE